MADSLSIEIRPDVISRTLDRTLQRAEWLLRIGLSASEYDVTKLTVPDRPLQIGFEVDPPWTSAKAREEYSAWLLANCFRDVVEGVAVVLEQLHRPLIQLKLAEQFVTAGVVRVEEWNAEAEKAAAVFHGHTFPRKLATLRDEIGVGFTDELWGPVQSLIAARNCLVHRGGIVGERDLNDGAALVVQWRQFVYEVQRGGRRERVAWPYVTREGDESFVVTEDLVARSFPLGSRVTFDATDFAGMCYTIHRFGVVAATLLLDACKQLGLEIRSDGKPERRYEVALTVDLPDGRGVRRTSAREDGSYTDEVLREANPARAADGETEATVE